MHNKSWMQIDQAVEWMIHEHPDPKKSSEAKMSDDFRLTKIPNYNLHENPTKHLPYNIIFACKPFFFPCNNMSLQNLLSRYLPFGG